MRPNTLSGAKRNIAKHYDLGNDFYGAWLDPSMTYSAALFATQGEDLTPAQARKYRTLARLAGLRPGDRVLEIGCGWGGFAFWAAREIGCRVTALTISKAQHEHAKMHLQGSGLAERVELRLQDYRECQGTFDAIVSVEMLEAVGERYWPTYFRSLQRCLRPGGRAALQVITIDDRHFEAYRRNADFIQRHIFPGGCLPSPTVLRAGIESAGFRLTADQGYARDYDRTLELWTERFAQAWPEIAKLGFDDRFKRMWHYYFAYCRAGFRTGRIDLRQVAFVKC